MTYREFLKLYKKNELDEKKKTEVEFDIERQEAISDYLYENTEIPDLEENLKQNSFATLEESTISKQEQQFTKMINRSIQKAFIKIGTVIGAVLLILLLFVQLVLPKIVSSFYYNPGKEVAKDTNQMSLDMAVYSELVMPCYFRKNVSAENKGYGNYDICICQNVSNTNTFTNVAGKIEKGKLILYNMNVLNPPAVNAFAWYGIRGDRSDSLTDLITEKQVNNSAIGSSSYGTEELQNLTENTKYVAYVTLDKMMEYEDFMKFIYDRGDFYSVWCAICTSDEETMGEHMFNIENIGFQCTVSSSTSLNWDRESYPNLLLWDAATIEAGKDEELWGNMLKEDFMTTHFANMLRYMSNQKKFLTMMDVNVYAFSNAADYVEKNGLTVYGFATVADKKTLLELNEKDEVYQVYTQPLR